VCTRCRALRFGWAAFRILKHGSIVIYFGPKGPLGHTCGGGVESGSIVEDECSLSMAYP
jgi:hypothetical protein